MKEIFFVGLFCGTLTLSAVMLGYLNMRVLPDNASFIEKMILCCMIFLTLFMYWLITKSIRCVLPARWSWGYRPPEQNYTDMTEHSRTQIIQGRPRLRIDDIWIIVYGVGLSYFSINYIFSCRDLLASTMITYAILMCIGTDIVISSVDLINMKNMMIALAACVCSISFGINFANDNFLIWRQVFLQNDIFSIVFRISIPFIGILFLNLLQDNKKITYTGAYELSEFGIPFASIIAFTFVIGNDSVLKSPTSIYNLFETEQMMTAVFLGPLPLISIILCMIDAILRRHNIDVFVSFTISTGILTLIANKHSIIGKIYLGCGLLAFILRLMSFIRFNKKVKDNLNNNEDIQMHQIVVPVVRETNSNHQNNDRQLLSTPTTIYEEEDEDDYYTAD
jgi:hypothetical protein